ncbi:MAG: 16S rRNA (guanine(527)-N(7))-methyltransferase RsmG [Leptolyngbyaceae cyanobacterium bins.349]|nr:16S rRNA (guanine(527)-N(7))-methyltransferase RsmG [Leptolyngbyaceae cyanobacterium bins.349]
MLSSDSAAGIAPLPDWADLWQTTLNWMPTSQQLQQFQTFYGLILQGNQQLNLTRITQPIEFSEKHLWDSLSGIKDLLASSGADDPQHTPSPPTANPFSVIDIGTGAGFPGIPIAIARPDWHITLLDSTRKKVAFLDQTLSALNLGNAATMVGRAEEIGQQRHYRAQYNLALIRAVAPATVCAEYTLPLLKVGGLAVLYRGLWSDEEAQALAVAVGLLGGEIEAIAAFKTPISQSDRHCVYLRKLTTTAPEYPRLPGVPSQKPLGISEEAQ